MTERLDRPGIEQLHACPQATPDGPNAFLALALSAVTDCDEQLFTVLADILGACQRHHRRRLHAVAAVGCSRLAG